MMLYDNSSYTNVGSIRLRAVWSDLISKLVASNVGYYSIGSYIHEVTVRNPVVLYLKSFHLHV